ncbi:hypothetical protein PV326_009308 [Microctonus aethiopoides]|nr:hypothetical protein PV326_009308 [Microctonus aethiopoides]
MGLPRLLFVLFKILKTATHHDASKRTSKSFPTNPSVDKNPCYVNENCVLHLPNYVSDSLKTSPETDGEGDIENDEAMDWSSSDEDNEDIDDNEKNYLHHSIFLQIQ